MNNIPRIKEEDFNFRGVISSIFRRKKSFFIITFSIFILSGIYAYTKKETWEGTFQIVLKQNTKNNSINSLINATSNPISLLRNQASQNKLNTEILILQSPSVLKPVYDYVKTEYDLLGYNTSKFRFRKWKNENLSVKLEKKSNVLRISYLDKEKEIIIPVLNKISQKYQAYSGKDRLKSLTKAKNYLDNQVLIYKEKTKKSSSQLQTYRNLHNIEAMSTGVRNNFKNNLQQNKAPNNSNNNVILNLESTYIRAKNQVTLINEKLKLLKEVDAKTNLDQKLAIYNAQIDSSKTAAIRKKIQEIDFDLARYKSAFNNEYPKIKFLEQLKIETFQQLQNIVIGYLEGQKNIELSIQKSSKRPQEVIAKYKDLYRLHNLNLETLSNLELERKINALSLAKETEPWELISNPIIYDKAVAPNKPRILLIGLFFGIVFGSVYVRFKDKNSDIIYDKNDIDNYLGYKNLFDFSNIDENKFGEIIDNMIINYFAKEKLVVFPIGDFVNDRSKKVLKLIKENKNMLKVVSNLKEIDEPSKLLILISINNLNKKELSYIKNYFILRKDIEISIAYI